VNRRKNGSKIEKKLRKEMGLMGKLREKEREKRKYNLRLQMCEHNSASLKYLFPCKTK